jgi:DNA-binding NtrC family response regulator
MSSFRTTDYLLAQGQDEDEPEKHHVVVVIDDDITIRESLAFLLSDFYDVSTFGSAKDGVTSITEDVCAVVLDVKMPGHDGFWACNEIRKRVPNMPVIFYSAYQNLKDPYAIINDHRPFGYVAKGDDVQRLLEMLKAAVELQSMIVANQRLLRALRDLQGVAP